MFLRNSGKLARLDPPPNRFDGGRNGRPLKPGSDDIWVIGLPVIPNFVPLTNTRTGHNFLLDKKYVERIDDDPMNGLGHCVLRLNTRVNIGGIDMWLDPVQGRPS